MNVPIPARIDLAPLANVELPAHARRMRTLAWIGLAKGAIAAGLVAWRFAPRVASRRPPSHRALWIAGAAGIASLGLARWQLQRLFATEPDYDVEPKQGPLEIRRYAPMQIARTSVGGDWRHALDEGFGRLARFIFGGNNEKKRIAMTAPVLGTREDDGNYRIVFVTPKGVVPPTPNDPNVALDALPARRVAVLRFKGGHGARTIETKKRELVREAKAAGLEPRGEASFAGYDPPTTLPILRRNEVWIEIA